MNIQKIDNRLSFQKLIIKNPHDMPMIVYSRIVRNQGIKDLAEKMGKKGSDLILEYKNNISPQICFLNAKQFFNKYFNYDDIKYSKDYNKVFTVKSFENSSPEDLLYELYNFDPFDIREEVHRDVCKYFEKNFSERKTNNPAQNADSFNKTGIEPTKKSFWQKLFN